jgi:hypothetical protein
MVGILALVFWGEDLETGSQVSGFPFVGLV